MHRDIDERTGLRYALVIERRLAARYQTTNPASHIVRARINDLERDLRRLDASLERVGQTAAVATG
jgi:hypothetical protein